MIVDAIIVGFIGFAAWRGWRRGLLLALTGFIGFIVAVAAAVFGYRLLAAPLRGVLKLSNGVSYIAGAVIIFIGITLGFFVLGRMLTKLVRITTWGKVNDAGGAALSGVWALSWVTVVLLSLSVIPAPKAIASGVEGSTIAQAIVRDAPTFTRSLARTDLRAMLAFFSRTDRGVVITATRDVRVEPHEERLLAYLIDEERKSHDLRSLRYDSGLAAVARAHALDMYRRGYFGHDSPEGFGTGTRLKRARIRFIVAGENLALAPTLIVGHNELMTSKRHRLHILSKRFTRVGVGVVFGPQGLLITQEFAA
jgi:uncharacterized protein YkwD/uncharacterized membrane protein required for colicin V production